MQTFLQVLYAGTGRPRQHLQTNGWPRCARPHGPHVSTEWVAACSRGAHVTVGIHSVDLAKCVNTHGLLQRHILGDAVQSYLSGSHTSGRLNRCRRAKQHVKPIHASAKITCSTLLTARSQHRYSKRKVLFATLAVSITAHPVKLVKPQLTFDELVKTLVSNALCWARLRCGQ